MLILKRWVPLVGVLLWFTACSVASFGYTALPTFAGYEIHRYLDLDDDQRGRVKVQLSELVQWHRGDELVRTVGVLQQARQKLQSPVTPEDIAWLRSQLYERWDPIAERLAQPAAELALSLRPAQIAHLRERLATANKKTRKDYLQTDPKERIAARVTRLRERVEFLYGDLNDAQIAEIAIAAKQSEFDTPAWFGERLRRQQLLLDTFDAIRREQLPLPQASGRMREMWKGWWKVQDPAHAQSVESALRASDQLTARLASLATPEQRLKADRKMAGWIKDFGGIAGMTGLAFASEPVMQAGQRR